MRKLDHMPEDNFLQAFQQEKRRELGALPPAKSQQKPLPAQPIAPPPPDPQVIALQRELATTQQELAQIHLKIQEMEPALQQAKHQQTELDRARRQADARVQTLQAQLREAEVKLQAAEKTSLWQDRGLLPAENRLALAELAVGQGQALFDALMTADPEPLRRLLNDRLVLVCGDAACQPTGQTQKFQVPKARCEMCGGSDLQLFFRDFANAVVRAKFESVTFVGGSPSYREKLRQLHRDLKPAFAIDVVEKKRPGEGKRAQAVRGLVVIWGGTQVDHDTTIHYQGRGDQVLTVDHRGLSGLLPRLTQRLKK